MNIKRFALGPLWTNGYIVSSSAGDTLLIDPAAEGETLVKWMAENGLKLSAVLLTHGHIDHVSAISEPGLAGKADIYIHPGDADMIKNPEKEFANRLGFKFSGVDPALVRELNDGDVLTFGPLSVKVIATPGHTQGSVCYLIKEDNSEVLFSGDTLFAGSVGRTDLAGGDADKLHKSLLILKGLSPELEVCPGHGPATTIYDESRRNPFWP